jgi:hypothetical protein
MFKSQYWLWCPILATVLGGQFGAAVYDMLIFTGPESILNKLYVTFVPFYMSPLLIVIWNRNVQNCEEPHQHIRRDEHDRKSALPRSIDIV